MQKANPYIGFNDWPYVLVGLPLVSFLIPQMFFQLYPWDQWDIFKTEWLEAALFTTTFWFLFRTIMIWTRKRYPLVAQVRKRLQTLFLIFFPTVPVVNVILGSLFNVCYPIDRYDPNLYQVHLTTYFISFSIIAAYEAVFFYTQLRQTITEKEQAKQAQIRSELEGLRNQVNPHFLFNSLNTLMHIVTEDQDLARRFLQRLSKVYRYILESRGAPLIPLEEELEFIRAYIFLQEERFLGNLKVNIQIDPLFYSYKIVPLSLQILFENAIKHNIISRKKPLLIDVFVNEHLQLVVSNNLQLKKQVLHSTQVGLENVSRRYLYFTDQKIEIKKDEQAFAVALPLIHPNKSSVYASVDY